MGIAAQSLSAADGVWARERDHIHAFVFENGVDFQRMVIRLAANAIQQRDGAHPGVNRMDVQVAFHRIPE